MISELAPKIIVAGGLAVVVGIIAVTVTLRSHHPTPVAQISQPPAALAQTPDVPAPVAPTPDAPAAPAPIPDAAVALAPNANGGGKIDDTASSAAVEPKVTNNQPAAKAGVSADTTNRSSARESSVGPHKKSADNTLVKNMDDMKSVEVPMPSAGSGAATDAQVSAPSNELASSDSRITTELKSQFASDSIGKDVDIGVTTTEGAVVLTGTLVTQDAIDHVKRVAEQVKDVKSVDTSAMRITTT
jgi:hyperosmotically inducible protein